MNASPRHRIVTCLSRTQLDEEVKKLTREGWRPIGEPALAAPFDLNRPPYWAQAMYLHSTPIVLESVKVEPPAASRMSRGVTEGPGPA